MSFQILTPTDIFIKKLCDSESYNTIIIHTLFYKYLPGLYCHLRIYKPNEIWIDIGRTSTYDFGKHGTKHSAQIAKAWIYPDDNELNRYSTNNIELFGTEEENTKMALFFAELSTSLKNQFGDVVSLDLKGKILSRGESSWPFITNTPVILVGN